MKYYLLFFLSLVFILQSSHADREDVDVAVLLKGMSNPYWKTLYDGANDKAKELGINAYIQGVQSDSDAEGQLNLCNTMLLRKPKALVVAAVNTVNLANCLREASKQGIPLIDVDGGMRENDAKKLGVKLHFSVASDNYLLGKKAAQYLNNIEGEALLIEGFPGSVPSELRTKGFKENLPNSMKLVASLPADWDSIKAANIANTIITKHPKLTAIFCVNDIMALGAAEALLARNVKNVKVIGVDGNADAVKAIKAGRLTASVAQLPYLIGGQAVEKANKLISGQAEYDFDQKVPIVTLDKEVLDKNDEPLLQYLK